MSYTGYSFNNLQTALDAAIKSPNMPKKLGQSMNGLIKVLSAITETRGEEDWAAKVVNSNGQPLLTPEEQKKLETALKPHIETIANALSPKPTGGAYIPDPSTLSGLSADFLKSKIEHVTDSDQSSSDISGPDDVYNKVINKIKTFDADVNRYASKHGVLRLEKQGDLSGDIRLIPETLSKLISSGVSTASTAAGIPIPIESTESVLAKFKVPLRLIIVATYLIMDITRITMGIKGNDNGRKLLSILVALLEIFRGDWKKAILTAAGYFGTSPMIYGEIFKVFLSMFRMLAPQIQDSIIYGSFDATKSMIIGLLLAVFQITAPEEVRLPLIGSLEKIARRKAEMDGILEEVGISARPDYLSPTWGDLNNIQAVMSDEAYLCSCEFQELVKNVNNAAAINLALQILRIPVTEEMRKLKCGDEPCREFVSSVLTQAKKESEREPKPPAPPPGSEPESEPTPAVSEPEPEPKPPTNSVKRGGRVLHLRRSKTPISGAKA
jgi:hypothetical protein